MKSHFAILILYILGLTSFYSCQKQEYLKSEKEIKKELQGTWILIPIPRYDTIQNPDHSLSVFIHNETWTFDDTKVTIVNNLQVGTSTYSVHTSVSKAEVYLDGIIPELILPARPRSNGTWQIVKLDGSILSIASDRDGASGLTQLEFHK